MTPSADMSERRSVALHGLGPVATLREIDEDDRVVKREGSAPGANNTLRAKVHTTPEGVTIVLSGAIDENSDLKGVFAQIVSDVTINMRGIERINSMGVHNWIPVITKAASQHSVALEEISYAIVQNAVAVANLFGAADVRSCMAPYFCATCKDNFTITVTREEVFQAGNDAPLKRCTRCQSPMEFDELDGYFSFFKARKAR